MILNKELTKYSSILLVVLGLGNCLVTSLHTWLSFVSHSKLTKPTPETGIRKVYDSEYSYIDRDYPIEFPFPPLPTVALTLHDSAVFSLNSVAALNSTSNITASLSPADKAKWETIVVHPHGMGRAQLGPSKRLFNTVFYHQLHCVYVLQRAIVDEDDDFTGKGHVQHCLNYLRQMALCHAMDGLEAGDLLERSWDDGRTEEERERYWGTLVCRDWSVAYDAMDDNFDSW